CRGSAMSCSLVLPFFAVSLNNGLARMYVIAYRACAQAWSAITRLLLAISDTHVRWVARAGRTSWSYLQACGRADAGTGRRPLVSMWSGRRRDRLFENHAVL